MSPIWQHPHVNIFKHFNVSSWKKSTKEGEVTTLMDKNIKCTVYRITGSIPAGNYMQLPKTSTQCLALTGRYMYLLFQPLAGKYFVVHLDVATTDNLIVRVSFSNLFKEFKSTHTWLQFPFVCNSPRLATSNVQGQSPSPAPFISKWTVLCLDLEDIVGSYLNKKFTYLKNIQLCANMAVKNVFTSDVFYHPGVTREGVRKRDVTTLGISPLPREMEFPLVKGEHWHDYYDFILFPAESPKKAFEAMLEAQQRNKMSRAQVPKSLITGKDVTDESQVSTAPISQKMENIDRPAVPATEAIRVNTDAGETGRIRANVDGQPATKNIVILPMDALSPKEITSLQPDPIIKLKRVIGYGGATFRDVLWTHDGAAIVYPCHAIVIAMNVKSGRQKFFIGHTDKVSCLSLTGDSSMLASGQTGQQSIVRVWAYVGGECLIVCKVHDHSLFSLSFSQSGSVLCGVGRDIYDNAMIVVWNTSRVKRSREATVVAKAHTKTDITRMKVSPMDDSRMVSCGHDNIRLWRVKDGSLRSAAVNLGYYTDIDFTDVCCEMETHHQPSGIIYACSRSGHIFEIDPNNITVKCVRRLLPSNAPLEKSSSKVTSTRDEGININSMCVRQTFCVTASDDGYLRLWPLDFSSVYLEAGVNITVSYNTATNNNLKFHPIISLVGTEHDGPVMGVDITSDGLVILAGTSTGTVGTLDIASRDYTTIMRSHMDTVTSVAVDPRKQHMTTVSSDNTIRIWDLKSLQQLYDFSSPNEQPSSVAYHPTQAAFACGFETGVIRTFNIVTTTMMAQLKQHSGQVMSLVYAPSGKYLYSACTQGTLCMYTIDGDVYSIKRALANSMVHRDRGWAECLALTADGRQLAFIGPTEFVVTLVDAETLDNVMRIDLTGSDTTTMDRALKVLYTPLHIRHLLVTTSNNKLLKLSTITGSIMSQIESVHRGDCTSLVMSSDGKHLATAGDKVVKVWDYGMSYDINFQVFIGHSEPINKLAFTPDNTSLISVGEAIFIWDFATVPPPSASPQISPRETEPTLTNEHYITAPGTKLNDSLASNPRSSPPHPQTPDHSSRVADISSIIQPSDAENMHSEDEINEINPNIQFVHRNIVEPHPDYTEVSSADIQDSVQKSMNASGQEQVDSDMINHPPVVHKHFVQRPKLHGIAQRRYVAAPSQAGLHLESVVGYNGNARDNVVWHPDTGLFIFTCGSVVVIEDLETSRQQHLLGHTEEISTLALQHDCQYLASASGACNLSHSQICIWQLSDHVCKMVLTHHEFDVVALAYSRDDRFLISIGDYRELSVVIWRTLDYRIVSSANVKHAIHAVSWDPYSVNEFATVGDNGSLIFWLLDETGEDMQLQLHEADLPDIISHHKPCFTNPDLNVRMTQADSVHLTGLQYTGDSTLYVSGSNGKISMWDTRRNACFMFWDADSAEIGVLVSRKRRLLTGSIARNIRLWSTACVGDTHLPPYNNTAQDAELAMEDEMTLDGPVISAAFDEQLEMGIVGTSVGTLWYINWTERTSIRLVSGHMSLVNAVSISSTNHFASCSDDGSLRIWSLTSHEQLMQFQVREHACKSVAFSTYSTRPNPQQTSPPIPDIVAGYSDGTVRMFDVTKGEMVLKMHPHASPVTAVAFSGFGRMILSGGGDGQIAVSSRTTGMTVRLITDHCGAPINNIDVALPPGDEAIMNTPILWLASSADRRLSIWSADWSKDFCELVDWLTFSAPAFCPDGTPLPKGDEMYEKLPPSLGLFSPNDSDVVVYVGYGMHKHVSFYSLAHKKVVRTCNLTHWCSSMDCSPINTLIAMGNHERLLKLMDSEEGSFQDFVGHNDSIHHVKFSKDSRYLLSVAYNEMFIWRVLV